MEPSLEPEVGPALERVIDASQRVVFERAELLRRDLTRDLHQMATRAGLTVFGGLFGLGGLWTLLLAGVVALKEVLPLSVCIAGAGLLQLAAGGVGLALARNRGGESG